MSEMKLNLNGQTISYGDKSKSKVLGLGKVVVTPDVSLRSEERRVGKECRL